MKFLTHLLKYLFMLITIFPGILIFVSDKIVGIKKIKSNGKYCLALSIVVLLNAFVYDEMKLFIIVILCIIIPYLFEYLFNEGKKVSKNNLQFEINSLKSPFFVMIFCPIFEEYIYRFFIYKQVIGIVNEMWVFSLISIFSFLFCHFVTQREKSIYKLPLAVVECIMFVRTTNIYICIVIHMAYNIMVYGHNMQKYMRNSNI